MSEANETEDDSLQAGFTKTIGLELAIKSSVSPEGFNVTCNAICPGYVLTDLVKNQLEATSKARGIPKVRWPLSRTRTIRLASPHNVGLEIAKRTPPSPPSYVHTLPPFCITPLPLFE